MRRGGDPRGTGSGRVPRLNDHDFPTLSGEVPPSQSDGGRDVSVKNRFTALDK